MTFLRKRILSNMSILSKPKWGAQAVVRGARPFLGPPVATALGRNPLLQETTEIWGRSPSRWAIFMIWGQKIAILVPFGIHFELFRVI